MYQKVTKLLSGIFVKELSKVFNWHNIDNLCKQYDAIDNLCKQSDVCDSDESLDAESITYCKRFPKSLSTSEAS